MGRSTVSHRAVRAAVCGVVAALLCLACASVAAADCPQASLDVTLVAAAAGDCAAPAAAAAPADAAAQASGQGSASVDPAAVDWSTVDWSSVDWSTLEASSGDWFWADPMAWLPPDWTGDGTSQAGGGATSADGPPAPADGSSAPAGEATPPPDPSTTTDATSTPPDPSTTTADGSPAPTDGSPAPADGSTPPSADAAPLSASAAPAASALASTTDAPTLSVSGQTVRWNAVSGVGSFVFVRKVPGQAPVYSIVTGTSITPPAVPGTTVNYGLRTNVGGSAWAPEVSIAYPTGPTPPPPPTPQPPPSTGFSMGIVAGSAPTYELSFLKALGTHTARVEFGIDTSSASMRSTIDAYAKAGIRPLLLATFYGRVPSSTEARNLGTWAAEFGPGGSFWAGKSYPANTAVTDIEFGNETSYSYQFSDNSSGTYAARAQGYAQRFRDAQSAIASANPRVGLLAIGDNAVNGTSWVTNMFKAVPDIATRAAGWTIHPYGPNWQARVDTTASSLNAVGASTEPIWITEWGLATDNGRCLSNNYGWNTCMSYAEAGSTLHTALASMKARYGSRLRAFYLYQAHDQRASGTATGREYYFGALQSGGATKGSYTTEVRADLVANP
jgi:hypothetical protein